MNKITHLKAKIIDSILCFTPFAIILGKRWFLRWEKSYILAEKELSILPDMIKSDSTFFDVGANRGELSFFFATKCNAKKVYAFEPQKRIFNVLRGVASKQRNIIPLNIAFSDSKGQKTIHIPIKTTGRYTQMASFDRDQKIKMVEEQVNISTIDSFIIENNLERLDFIKCDTEGHELSVFKGAKETLKLLRPILYVEIKESNKVELFRFLKGFNYVAYGLRDISSENYYFCPVEKETYLPKEFSRRFIAIAENTPTVDLRG